MKGAQDVIKSVQLTEKGTALMEKENKYFFVVAEWANKLEIRRATEELFKVKVAKVNTLNYLGKKKRERSQQYGSRGDWKRAIVTLKAGEKIDFV